MSNPVGPPPPGNGPVPPPPPPGFGGAPQPGQGFGTAPQSPDQGFGAAPQPPEQGFGAAPAPAKKKRGKLAKIVGFIVVALVIAGLKFGVGSLLFGDKAADAKVGDCIAATAPGATGEKKEADAKVVECTAADAAYTVVGRVDDQTEAQANDAKACEQFFKEGEAYSVFSSIPEGGKGYLLCLRKKA